MMGVQSQIPPVWLCLCGLTCLSAFGFHRAVQAQTIRTVALPVEAPSNAEPPATPSNFGELLRSLLLESLKHEYIDQRHWGRTVERFDGFHIRGLRISKRERDVPHGFWQRYKARLIRPEEFFEVQLTQEDPLPSGQIPFSIVVSLRARCEATFIWWAYGVKGINGTTVSDATLQLGLKLETSPRLNFGLDQVWPQFELRPRVTAVDLRLKDLDVRRIGIVEGDLAKVLGDGSRKAVEALLQQQEGRIRKRIQEQLDADSHERD